MGSFIPAFSNRGQVPTEDSKMNREPIGNRYSRINSSPASFYGSLVPAMTRWTPSYWQELFPAGTVQAPHFRVMYFRWEFLIWRPNKSGLQYFSPQKRCKIYGLLSKLWWLYANARHGSSSNGAFDDAVYDASHDESSMMPGGMMSSMMPGGMMPGGMMAPGMMAPGMIPPGMTPIGSYGVVPSTTRYYMSPMVG